MCKTLIYILSFLVTVAMAQEWLNKYSDCSNVLKNRIASFEYLYYPAYWMYPSGSYLSLDYMTAYEAKSYKYPYVKWIIHQSPNDKNRVVIESAREDFDDYYLFITGVETGGNAIYVGSHFYSHLDDIPKGSSNVKIFCTSCLNEAEVFDDCVLQLYYGVRTDLIRYIEFSPNSWGYAGCTGCWLNNSWSRFRIYAPPVQTGWEEVFRHRNCDSNIPVRYSEEFRSSVTITTKTSHKIKESVTVAWAKKVADLFKVSEVSATLEHEWTYERIEEAQKERKTVIGGSLGHPVPPNKIWVGYQKVGSVAYWKIKSLVTETKLLDC